jgi:hypothetical protein
VSSIAYEHSYQHGTSNKKLQVEPHTYYYTYCGIPHLYDSLKYLEPIVDGCLLRANLCCLISLPPWRKMRNAKPLSGLDSLSQGSRREASNGHYQQPPPSYVTGTASRVLSPNSPCINPIVVSRQRCGVRRGPPVLASFYGLPTYCSTCGGSILHKLAYLALAAYDKSPSMLYIRIRSRRCWIYHRPL